ncbi:cysteine desulfurase family protein [Fastidiosipila sanguinis]|uniref:Cysteine desulfurase NifS n=1 Tax=Fastidiosipila sanguinis TaxID=236753 RepID=A0A2S0KM91_9FIRM|nr:cysteine desulfurase family protein [Fastidiosipila sanguinis]AVM42146.1 cysteine desulfurase NifS [Fastidiosipila sanguinis]
MPYFDHAATTKPLDSVITTISKSMERDYYNPASLYDAAKDVEKKIKNAYIEIAKTLNCTPDELIQTSGATESTNMAFKGLFTKYGHRLNKIIASAADHDASLNTLKFLEAKGAEVVLLKPNKDGLLDLDELKSHLDSKTLLVSILHTNNETGVVQDLNAISKIVREHAEQAFIHADLVQSWGKVELNLNSLDIDLASFSGHKIHGPKSTGLLYIRSQTYPEALIHGGGQQNGWRSGTEDWPLLSGLTEAAKSIYTNFEENNTKVSELRDFLVPELKSLGATINFPNAIPHILSISFPKYRGETLLHMLASEGVYVSTSSACNAKSAAVSHVLTACNMDRKQAEGTLRISLDSSNTIEEAEELLKAMRKVIQQMIDWGM